MEIVELLNNLYTGCLYMIGTSLSISIILLAFKNIAK